MPRGYEYGITAGRGERVPEVAGVGDGDGEG